MTSQRSADGVWPAMITPLRADWTIDWHGVDALTEWYIASGVAGLFAVGQSGEMFRLTDEERIALARRVVEQAAGRVPVVASGTFGGPLHDQALFIQRMADTGVRAVTVLASEVAGEHETDAVWQSRLEELLRLTGDIPLALYECPEPYHRKVEPELLAWAAQSGRFIMMKETSRSLERVKAKIAATAGTCLRVFNADATTLLPSMQIGAAGYCGIAANFFPDILVWLCAHFREKPELASEVQAVISSVDAVIHLKYPVCAKAFQRHAGIDIRTISRVTSSDLSPYDIRVLEAIANRINQLRTELATA